MKKSFKYRRATDWLRVNRAAQRQVLNSWYEHYKGLGVSAGIYEKEETWTNGDIVITRALFVEGEEVGDRKVRVEDFVIPAYKHIEGFMFTVRN